MRVLPVLGSVLVVLFGVPVRAQAPRTLPYDHVHMAAPDPEKALDWYKKNLGGIAGESAERVAFESVDGPRAAPRPVPLHQGA